MAKKVDTLHRMDFDALSVQSIPNFREDFLFYFIKLVFLYIYPFSFSFYTNPTSDNA